NVEFDNSFSRVTVQMNVSDQGNNVSYYETFKDCVNDDVMWNFIARSVKLDDITYERMVYGQDQFFFVVNLEFGVDERWDPVEEVFYSGHDRRIVNYGDEVLIENGDKNNPLHYESYRKVPDREKGKVLLDQEGKPWKGDVSEGNVNPPYVVAEYFE